MRKHATGPGERLTVTAAMMMLILSMPALAEEAGYWGDGRVGIVVTDNVYRDNSRYSAVGTAADAALGVRKILSSRSRLGANYGMNAILFAANGGENEHRHSLNGALSQGLWDRVTVDLAASGEAVFFTGADNYDYRVVRGAPSFRIQPLATTEVRGGVSLDYQLFPDYDLDSRGMGADLLLEQDLWRGAYVQAFAGFLRREYTERMIYGAVSIPPTETGTARRDNDGSAGVRLFQEITGAVRAELGFRHERLASNGNFFCYGPWQTELTNTFTGDEVVMDDYYSYGADLVEGSIGAMVGARSRLVVSAGLEFRSYDGRLARDETDLVRAPAEKRRDRRFVLSVRWPYSLGSTGGTDEEYSWGVIPEYRHERNSTNEALYDCPSNSYSLSLTGWF